MEAALLGAASGATAGGPQCQPPTQVGPVAAPGSRCAVLGRLLTLPCLLPSLHPSLSCTSAGAALRLPPSHLQPRLAGPSGHAAQLSLRDRLLRAEGAGARRVRRGGGRSVGGTTSLISPKPALNLCACASNQQQSRLLQLGSCLQALSMRDICSMRSRMLPLAACPATHLAPHSTPIPACPPYPATLLSQPSTGWMAGSTPSRRYRWMLTQRPPTNGSCERSRRCPASSMQM